MDSLSVSYGMGHNPPSWPVRSLEQCTKIMTAPGSPWEYEEKVINGRPLRVYKSMIMPPSLQAFWLASKPFGDRVYVVYENECYTYAEAHARTNRIANLLAGRGVKKGDRVGIASRNLPDWIFAFWAIHLLGGVAVAVNAWSPLEPLTHCITKAECSILFVDEERAKVVVPSLGAITKAGCRAVFVFGKESPGNGFESLSRVLEGIDDRPPPPVAMEPEDYATIFYTSGTTSLPKGVLATQRQFLSNRVNTGVAMARAILRRGENLPAPDPNARQSSILLSVPLFHVTGNHSFLALATSSGGKIVLMRKWDLPTAIELVKKEEVTTAGGVPSMVLELIEAPELHKPGTHYLEGLSFGGAAPSHKLPNSLQNRMPQVIASQAYGLTETNAIATSHCGEEYFHRPLSCGLPVPTAEIRIVDLETKKESPPRQPGEIWLRGPMVAEGYYKDPEATKRDFTDDGWFKSGDVGYVDESGFLYITDRAKEIIIRGGENISTISVENAIYSDDRVQEAAVVPVPDEKLGELVAAVVVLKEAHKGKVSSQELVDGVRKRVPKHCVPVLLVVREEGMPRNPSGKTLKKVLKEQLGKIWMEQKRVKAKL